MIGVDITSIERFKNKKINLFKKILSDEEFDQWKKSENKELFAAQRWAIKEALFKADNSLHDFHNINIKRDKRGAFIFKDFLISTSKENEYVVAFVLSRKESNV